MRSTVQTKPYRLDGEEKACLPSSGPRVSIKATSEQTGGIFNLFEICCPPGFATPLHIHYAEDVAVFVLEGALTFYWGSERNEAGAGSYFYQPRGTPHGFRVRGGSPARILCTTCPAGLDQFVAGNHLSSQEGESETEAARHKIEILGPLPE